MTTDWVQAALLPLFILVVSVGEFLILGFIPFRHELLRSLGANGQKRDWEGRGIKVFLYIQSQIPRDKVRGKTHHLI